MSTSSNDEINLLCVGDILSGKSAFLQSYTQSEPENLHYRVYSKIDKLQTIIYFHQVKERFGMEAYFSYPFDGILYFLNIDDFHNPQFSIIQQLAQISKINGTNIFKMPLKVIVLSSKTSQLVAIEKAKKQNLIKQLDGMVTPQLIIFVESNQRYREELSNFYIDVINGECLGIRESLYVDWQLKGTQGLIPFENIIFNLKKMWEVVKKQCSKLRLSSLLGKKQQ